ncbi:hypothetical protein L9F63_014546, partial [Diploptera punctata]
VMYCSEECRTASWDESHCIECSILPTLQKLETSILASKIVIKACKTNDLKNMLKCLEAEEIKKGCNNEGVYSSSNYSLNFWLVTHIEKITFGNLFESSLNAACILHCLETMTDFFSDIDVNEYKYEVGSLLLHHILQIRLNTYGIKEIVNLKDYFEKSSPTSNQEAVTGYGIYAVSSLLNHSCDPNSDTLGLRGDVIVIRANRPIVAGEQ